MTKNSNTQPEQDELIAEFANQQATAREYLPLDEGFNDPFWNLGQILAWVETRSPFAVDMLSDTDALSKRSHSMPPTMPHHAAEWAAHCAEQYGYPQFACPFRDVKQIYLTVLRHFQLGELLALRPEAGSAEPKRMSGTDWMNLEIGEDLYGEVVISYRGASRATYRDVRVERAAILKIFEPVTSVDTATEKPTETDYHLMQRKGNGKLHTAVFDAMAEIWEDHRVPKSLSIPDIEEKIADGIKRRGFVGGPGRDNIRRILVVKT